LRRAATVSESVLPWTLTGAEREVLDWARAFASTEIEPVSAEADRVGQIPGDAQARFHESTTDEASRSLGPLLRKKRVGDKLMVRDHGLFLRPREVLVPEHKARYDAPVKQLERIANTENA